MSSVLTHSARPVRVGVDGLGKRGRDTVRVSPEPALPIFDTPKDTGLPTLRSRPKRLTRVGGCRFGYVARHSLVHGFAQCRYLIEQAVEIIARNT